MRSYFRYELTRLLRNGRYVFFTIAYPVILYLFFSHVGGGGKGTAGGIAISAYVMVSMAVFGASGAAIGIAAQIANERDTGWTRQLRLTPLPSWGYVTAKIVSGLAIAVCAFGLVFAVGGIVEGVSLPLGHWLTIAGMLLVALIPFAALGVFLGYLASGTAGRAAMMFPWLLLSLFGGLWMPISTMPTVMADVAHGLPTFQMANLAWRSLAGQSPTTESVLVLAAWTVGLVALAGWRYRRDSVRPA